MPSSKSRVVIISPAAAESNNGNWRTAHRWHRFLARRHATSIAAEWTPASGPADLMIALHARRSADSIRRFVAATPKAPVILVLTGTDIYRDIAVDPAARESLESATRLVLLEPEGLAQLSTTHREKAEVILQSSPTLAPRSPDPRWFDLIMVAHLRDEKDPATAWRAFEQVSRTDLSIRFIHVGGVLDPEYEDEAAALSARNARFRWLGAMSHPLTRQQIRRARVLVITSVMEGGAHVISEAITSGVPVIASAIPGNIGLLGRNYAGTFPVGDSRALATMLERVRRNPDFLALLRRQCAERAVFFRPERERQRLITLVASCSIPPRSTEVPS